LHFVGWDEHTLSFVGFRFTQPNLHFISSIAQCETQQRPILEPIPKILNNLCALRVLCGEIILENGIGVHEVSYKLLFLSRIELIQRI
jgi:hypothetical protein